MKIIEIQALTNGAHRNQGGDFSTIPNGWAVIPDYIVIPDTFPFVDIEVEEITYYREEETVQNVTKTREVSSVDDMGNPVTVTEEYTEQEIVMEQKPYTAMTVTSMDAGVVPEPEPEQKPATVPTVWDELDAAYTEGVNAAYDE